MKAPRLTIPTRIFLALIGVLIAFGIVSIASLLQHQRTAATIHLLHEGYVPLALRLGSLQATERVVGNRIDGILGEADPAATLLYLETTRRFPETQIALTVVDRADHLAPPEEQPAIAEVRDHLRAVEAASSERDALLDELTAALELGDREAATRLLEDVRHHGAVVARHLRDASVRVSDQIAATSTRSAQQEREAVYELAILALLALAAGLGVTWWSQRLLAPLPRLEQRVLAVARGDLSRAIADPSPGDDEIGKLAREFERMVDALATRDRELRDVAESLRELQGMQAQVLASLRAAVLVVDGDGTVRSVNRAAATMLGVSRDAIGTGIADTGLPARLDGLERAIDSVATTGTPASITSALLRTADVDRRVDVRVTPFGDAPAARRSVLVVADDVTEELDAKARLIQGERLAAMGKMAAHVTHEVRNPLSSIGLNVELLADELGDRRAETQPILGSIRRELERLTGITEEYLRLARLPAPRLEREDVGSLVESLLSFSRLELDQAGVRIALRLDPELPSVMADEPQLRQALLNLVRNAREAMPGGGTLTIAASARDGGVAIDIADQGEGIEPSRRGSVFDVFYTTKEHGTGLGLPLTREIVLAHRGRIHCDEAPGGGALFSIWLPTAAPPADEVPRPSEPELAAAEHA